MEPTESDLSMMEQSANVMADMIDLAFNKAKIWIYLGCLTGFLLWFLGFIVVGGEWFCMWQSEKWNGVEAAFRFVVLIMLTLLFTAMSESVDNK